MIKVSVVVPVYNTEDLLGYTIESICNQTLKDIEIILVNDGSTDKSGDICDEYARKDNRIRVFHKKNGGGASARNYGANYVRGEYLYYMDCDDLLSPTQLEKMYNVGKETDADLVYVDAYYVAPNGEKTEYNAHPKTNLEKGYTTYNLQYKEDRDRFYDNYNFACRAFWFHIEKTKVYKKITAPMVPTDDTYGFFEKLSAASIVAFIHENLYLYRFPREGSIMNKFNKVKFSLYGIDTRLIYAEGIVNYFGESKRAIDGLIKQYLVAYNHIDYYKGEAEEWLYIKDFIKRRLFRLSSKASLKNKLRVRCLINYPAIYRFYSRKIQKNKAYMQTI